MGDFGQILLVQQARLFESLRLDLRNNQSRMETRLVNEQMRTLNLVKMFNNSVWKKMDTILDKLDYIIGGMGILGRVRQDIQQVKVAEVNDNIDKHLDDNSGKKPHIRTPNKEWINISSLIKSITPLTQSNNTPLTQPINTQSTTPLTQPTNAPLTQSSNTPLTQSKNTPLTQPSNNPLTQSTITPLTQPSNTPLIKPHNTPLTKPHNTPLTKPHTTPLTQPSNTPLRQQKTTPKAKSSSTPLTQPNTTPLRQQKTTLKAKSSSTSLTQSNTTPLRQQKTTPTTPLTQPTNTSLRQQKITPKAISSSTPLTQSNITPLRQQKTTPTTPLPLSMPVITDSVPSLTKNSPELISPSLTEDSPGFDPDFLSLLEEAQISVQKKQDRPLVILSETQYMFEEDQEENNRKGKKIKLESSEDLTQNQSNNVKSDDETAKMGTRTILKCKMELGEFELNETVENDYFETEPHEDSSSEMIETVTVNNNDSLTIVDHVVNTDTNNENYKNFEDPANDASGGVGSDCPSGVPRYVKLTSPSKLLKNSALPVMGASAPQFNISYTIYNCDACGERFFSRNDAETHVKVNHGWKQ